MATVEKGLMNPHTEMQQGNAVNSTLNFMPAVPSWSVLPAAHDHSYATIWEQPAASSTHHGEGQGGSMSCINLMGRMAYVDGNPAGGGFNIMEGNLDWMAAKYTSTNHENNNNHNNYDDDDHTSSAKVNNLRHHDLNLAGRQEMHYLEHPVSPQEEADEAVSSSPSPSTPSSCLLHHAPSPSSALLFKRQGVLHPHHSPLLKKQRSSSFSPKETCSKEDPPASNGSSEVGPALNTNGRPRAKRGSATDPQSVYARQRRERINERLKILQNLVPNGAKVDIVTMLEEAISYVKFLQLQVKLLSSDEYWMYAPTTYNGIDVSFDMLQHSS